MTLLCLNQIASIYSSSNAGGTNAPSTHPQINNNANNGNNNVAGPGPSQRRWVPPSRDRRAGGEFRIPTKVSQGSPLGILTYKIILHNKRRNQNVWIISILYGFDILFSEYGVGPRPLAGGRHSPSTGSVTPNVPRGGNINNSSTVNDIPPNTTYSKFSASLAANHAQAVSSSGGNNREADKELSRNDVAFRKVSYYLS